MDVPTASWNPQSNRYPSQGPSSPPRGIVSVVVPRPGSTDCPLLTVKEEHVVGRGGNGGSTGTTANGGGTSVTCGGVTVTSINVSHTAERPPPDGKSGESCVEEEEAIQRRGNAWLSPNHPRCSISDDSGSDSEISRIDFSSVRMRAKKGRGGRRSDGDGFTATTTTTGSNQDFSDSHHHHNHHHHQPERPMSWEGELLSDTEMSLAGRNEDADECMDVQQAATRSHNNHNDNMIEGSPKQCRIKTEPGNHINGHQTSMAHTRELPLLVDKLLGGYSPVLQRQQQTHLPPTSNNNKQHHLAGLPPNPSPDSAIHSAYSSPCTFTPSLSRNNSDASQYGGSQHSSCYSYTSSSPAASPVQPRHHMLGGSPLHHPVPSNRDELLGECLEDKMSSLAAELNGQQGGIVAGGGSAGISRQQLINSPCPICGDKISGFHYGIFSCESCKGFFKRTVQNRKNYVCLRGSQCPVTIATRKKCPACRFEKCLKMGMKLEAIREDRTRGGRSTYQCSYSVPQSLLQNELHKMDAQVKLETPDCNSTGSVNLDGGGGPGGVLPVPQLLQEMMEVEHLWHCNEREMMMGSPSPSSPHYHNDVNGGGSNNINGMAGSTNQHHGTSHRKNGPEDADTNGSNNGSATNQDFLANLCNIADHRLYKIVKWCKSLPLFKNISIDDQISLLINSWCELLLFSCCFRSMSSPGEIRVSLGKSISLGRARELGLGPCIERMLNLTQHLRRLRLDKYEYVAMKVIVLLTSDVSDLREPEKVRGSQEKALQALQHYTLAHYPDTPSKFGELLLRIPELQRTCQVGKEMLSIKNRDGEDGPSFNLLMELLRGDH